MKTWSVTAALLSLGSVVLVAAPAGPVLSLDDCLGVATQRQPALAVAQAGVQGAKEGVGEARAPYFPQVDLNAAYHRWQRRAFLPSGLALPGRTLPDLIGPLDDWNGGVASRVTLFDFGERRAGLDVARARAASAEADAGAVRAEVRLQVETAFFALAAAQELEGVADKNVARTEAHHRLAEARRDAGAVPQADVLRLDAELANARLQAIAAKTRVQVAAGQLNTAMGRPADTPLAINAAVAVPPPPGPDELDRAVERALSDRPELASAERRTEAARAALAGARAARAPKLRADAAYGWRDTELWPETHEWQAGLSVDFPLFDGGSRRHHVARSRADVAREEASLEQRRLAVRNEVWSSVAELQRSWASIAANEAAVSASNESLRVVRERYERGAALLTDLLDTQTALARAEASLAEARWSYQAARAEFRRAVGSQ